MHNFAKHCEEMSKYAWNENLLLEAAMWCWLDPIMVVDMTYEEKENE